MVSDWCSDRTKGTNVCRRCEVGIKATNIAGRLHCCLRPSPLLCMCHGFTKVCRSVSVWRASFDSCFIWLNNASPSCRGVGMFICTLEYKCCETIRKNSFSLSHCFVVTTASLTRRLLLSWGGEKGPNLNHILLILQFIFCVLIVIQINSKIMGPSLGHAPPFHQVSWKIEASLGLLYHLGFCQKQACASDRIITIQQGRKMSSSSEGSFSLHLSCLSYLISLPQNEWAWPTRSLVCCV